MKVVLISMFFLTILFTNGFTHDNVTFSDEELNVFFMYLGKHYPEELDLIP